MKNTITALIIIVLVGLGFYLFVKQPASEVTPTDTTKTEDGNTPVDKEVVNKESEVIGKSVDGRDITAYHYGTGKTELLFVGGIHGGYSWNTVLVAYELMDYLKTNPSTLPGNVKLTVIPVMNPDGLYKVTGTEGRFTKALVSTSQTTLVSGRFNARDVDLSRNFDCNWKATGVWQTRPVSGGISVFSEPESQAVRNYVQTHKISGAVVWYSAAGGVYASSCDTDVSLATSALTNTYADASGYPAFESFDFYETSGDMVNWLAKMKIPAISVLLTNHQDTDWDKNLRGIKAVLEHYAE